MKQDYPKIISANDLLLGDVVYFDATAQWTRHLRQAVIAHTSEQANALLAEAASQVDRAVGVYLVDVELDAQGTPTPRHFRERFREYGPTTHTDLGRQAVGLTQSLPESD